MLYFSTHPFWCIFWMCSEHLLWLLWSRRGRPDGQVAVLSSRKGEREVGTVRRPGWAQPEQAWGREPRCVGLGVLANCGHGSGAAGCMHPNAVGLMTRAWGWGTLMPESLGRPRMEEEMFPLAWNPLLAPKPEQGTLLIPGIRASITPARKPSWVPAESPKTWNFLVQGLAIPWGKLVGGK